MKTDSGMLNKIFTNRIEEHIKKITHHHHDNNSGFQTYHGQVTSLSVNRGKVASLSINRGAENHKGYTQQRVLECLWTLKFPQ